MEPLKASFGTVTAGQPIVVTVQGDVDLATSSEFESVVRSALSGAPSAVIVDLKALTFLDSSGLRALVGLQEQAQAQGASFALRDLPRNAQRLLELTGLLESFDLAPE